MNGSMTFSGGVIIALATLLFYSTTGKEVPDWLISSGLRGASEDEARGFLRFCSLFLALVGSLALSAGLGLLSSK